MSRVWKSVAERHGDLGRDLALYLGRRYAGLSLRLLVGETGIWTCQTAAQAIWRMLSRIEKDPACRDLASEAINCLNAKTGLRLTREGALQRQRDG
jgi:hypothetical protein